MPVILVGGLRSLETCEDIVASGDAELVAMSRPFIREPGLVARWQAGDTAPAACVNDNLCFAPARSGQGLYCVTEARQG
jgi:2,4-dienoyl-CoA reductase-like NADH-dependent reductase (Old Yellow Enzyme family)